MNLRPETFEFVRTLLRNRCGVVLEDSKEYLVVARLGPVVRRMGLESVDALVARLRSAPQTPLHREVVEALVTTETSFFRDVHPFRTLKDAVLPDLIERRRSSERLRFWSAACSSGQEPYSLAMLLREHFPQLTSWFVSILGSDVSDTMVQRAKIGAYSQLEINRGVPARFLTRYFEREGIEWRVTEPIRSMVEFRTINLVEPLPIQPRMDVIFLRNVLIYFDEATRRSILERLVRHLASDGYLFVGGAETMIGYTDLVERERIGDTSVYRPPGREERR